MGIYDIKTRSWYIGANGKARLIVQKMAVGFINTLITKGM